MFFDLEVGLERLGLLLQEKVAQRSDKGKIVIESTTYSP
jgi:hypothetical protein